MTKATTRTSPPTSSAPRIPPSAYGKASAIVCSMSASIVAKTRLLDVLILALYGEDASLIREDLTDATAHIREAVRRLDSAAQRCSELAR